MYWIENSKFFLFLLISTQTCGPLWFIAFHFNYNHTNDFFFNLWFRLFDFDVCKLKLLNLYDSQLRLGLLTSQCVFLYNTQIFLVPIIGLTSLHYFNGSPSDNFGPHNFFIDKNKRCFKMYEPCLNQSLVRFSALFALHILFPFLLYKQVRFFFITDT